MLCASDWLQSLEGGVCASYASTDLLYPLQTGAADLSALIDRNVLRWGRYDVCPGF